MTAPHVHTVEEAKSNISSIEHIPQAQDQDQRVNELVLLKKLVVVPTRMRLPLMKDHRQRTLSLG